MGGQTSHSTLRFLAGRVVDDLERRTGKELYSQARCYQWRAASLQRRGARRQRRVSHRGQHGRCGGADVAVASQRRAARGGYRVDPSATVVFSIGRAKKFGASQSSEVIRGL